MTHAHFRVVGLWAILLTPLVARAVGRTSLDYQLTVESVTSGGGESTSGDYAIGSSVSVAAPGGTAGNAGGTLALASGSIAQRSSLVAARWIFYNQSAWDGNGAAANAADDAAIATDKAALLPGGTATLANYTSFYRGINGIMVDVTELHASPSTSDFRFRTGNDNTPSGWLVATAPVGVAVRWGAGVAGSDRITLVWASGAILKQWLQVQVRATTATGLGAGDDFYFGNAIGDSGNSAFNTQVDLADEIGARNHPRTFLNPSPIDDAYDYNRDKRVDLADEITARNNGTTFLTALKLIHPPAAASPGPSLPPPVLGTDEPPKPARARTEIEPAHLFRAMDSSGLFLGVEAFSPEGLKVETCGDLIRGEWQEVLLPLVEGGASGIVRWELPGFADVRARYFRVRFVTPVQE